MATVPPPSLPLSLNFVIAKKYLTKLVSLGLILSGVRDIFLSLIEIFKYSTAVQTSTSLIFSQFHQLFKMFLFQGTHALIETVYGLILLAKPSQKVKLAHIALGIIIFLLPFIIPDTLLRQAEENLIPSVYTGTSIVLAQQTTLDQAISDYQFQWQKYRDSHSQYLSAKNTYLSFQTLNSRTDAIDKTKVLLAQRAQLLRSYLFALRILLINSPPSNPKTTALISRLESEEQNLSSHLQSVDSISSLQDVSRVSQALENNYPNLQILSYQALFAHFTAEQGSVQSTLLDQSNSITQLIESVNPNEFNLTQVNQWLEDTQSTLQQNQATFIQAQDLLAKLKPTSSLSLTNQRNFTKILSLLEDTRTQLQTAIGFIQETIKLLRYG